MIYVVLCMVYIDWELRGDADRAVCVYFSVDFEACLQSTELFFLYTTVLHKLIHQFQPKGLMNLKHFRKMHGSTLMEIQE